MFLTFRVSGNANYRVWFAFFVKKLEATGCVLDFQGVWECKLQDVVYISQHSEITIPKNAGHCFWVKIMKTSRSDGFSNKKMPPKREHFV